MAGAVAKVVHYIMQWVFTGGVTRESRFTALQSSPMIGNATVVVAGMSTCNFTRGGGYNSCVSLKEYVVGLTAGVSVCDQHKASTVMTGFAFR
jgi:hypothetical protein